VADGRNEVGILELAPEDAEPQPRRGTELERPPSEHCEQRRRLRDGARERADVIARRREREHAFHRHEAERRLEAHDPAVRSRETTVASRSAGGGTPTVEAFVVTTP